MRCFRMTVCAGLAVCLCLCAACGGTTPSVTVTTGSDPASCVPDCAPILQPTSVVIPEATEPDAPTTEPATEATEHTHMYVSEVFAPTCIKGGYTLKTCACGSTMCTDEKGPLGHAFGTPTISRAATCTTQGIQSAVCRRCGQIQTTPTPRTPHAFGAWSVTQIASDTIRGEETCRCQSCGYTIRRTIPPYSAAIYTEAQEALDMLELINAERRKAGVRPLAFDFDRYVCVDVRARESIENFSHTRPNGQKYVSVIAEQGCVMPDAWAENLQYNIHPQYPLQSAHEILMASEGHRKNILNPVYATVSIRVLRCEAGTYVAQLFCA